MSSLQALFAQSFASGAREAAPDAPLGKMQREAPKMKRCVKLLRADGNRCNGELLASDSRVWCKKCRKQKVKEGKTEKGKAKKKRYTNGEKGKAKKKRYKNSEKGKATEKRYKNSDKGKAAEKRYVKSDKGKAAEKRYRKSDKGKACTKRKNAKTMHRLSRSLGLMLAGTHENPVSFPKLGLFVDNADAQAHFASTFAPWMHAENQGVFRTGMAPNTVWQNGHRIPKAWYRHDDEAEVKKCWSRTNLFAQCAAENVAAGNRNLLSREAWLALKPIWPKQCNGMTDEEAWQWASHNVDNATRAKNRKRKREATTAPKQQYESDRAES